MPAQCALLIPLLIVLLCPLGVTAQKPGPEEADILAEEATAEEVEFVLEGATPEDAGTVSAVCGAASGTRFNLEPRVDALPQHTESVAFLLNRVAAGVDLIVGAATDHRGRGGSRGGYYVSRDADCAPEFEGGLPPLRISSSEELVGLGPPVVVADPARGTLFMADRRASSADPGSAVAIGLFRTTARTLRDPTACPNGTHTDAQATTCWPTTQLVRTGFRVLSGPHLAVDERTSGTGAGNVYLVFSEFDVPVDDKRLLLVACTNSLVTCAAPVTVTVAPDSIGLQVSQVAVRPDGQITILWTSGDFAGMSIAYHSCTPAVPPTAPRCGSLSGVHSWDPISVAETLATYPPGLILTRHPQHAHRVEVNGTQTYTETYVVWDQCKPGADRITPLVFCPDADVVMKASRDNGVTWSALTCVNCGAQDQFRPAITVDRSRNIINIVFYGSGSDATFQHRVRLLLAHIHPGAATPDPVTETHTLTTLLNDPSGDPYKAVSGSGFGAYIGIAARGTGLDGQSRAYVHYTYNNIQGVYEGHQVPEPNNHLSRFDY